MSYLKGERVYSFDIESMDCRDLRLLLRNLVEHLDLTVYKVEDSQGELIEFEFRKEW